MLLFGLSLKRTLSSKAKSTPAESIHELPRLNDISVTFNRPIEKKEKRRQHKITKATTSTTIYCTTSIAAMIPERIPAKDLIKNPKAADEHVVSSIARQGMIGQCLQSALDDILAEDAAATVRDTAGANADRDDDTSQNEDAATKTQSTSATKRKMPLTQPMVDNIMTEFGRAVARSKYNIAADDNDNDIHHKKKRQTPLPPRALMRGKVDHFNRFNGKWRIVVKPSSVELKRRVALPKVRRKTQREGRPTLWEAVVLEEDDGDSGAVVTIPGAVQVLAYDDMA